MGNRTELSVGILSCSDACHEGAQEDSYGKRLAEMCTTAGWHVIAYHVCPNDVECIEASLMDMCDVDEADLVLTVGGTGVSLREVTPEATAAAATRLVPGISEGLRAAAAGDDAAVLLSRSISAQRGRSLIVNLPACEGGFEAAATWLLERSEVMVAALRG